LGFAPLFFSGVVALNIAVLLNAHENSDTFRDTLESVATHWTKQVIVVVDGKNWGQFRDASLPAMKLEGFHHGKPNAPFRNMCLGLMKAWDTWKNWADWVCYLEYDCLVGSDHILGRLSAADKSTWMFGNDYQTNPGLIPFIDRFQGEATNLHYLLGCCLFFNGGFMARLAEADFFERFLTFTNFHTGDPSLKSPSGKEELVYDLSEWLYPSLAVKYGGGIKELAGWENPGWHGDGNRYPMRFEPDLHENWYEGACVMHPLKDFSSGTRAYHRLKRKLTLVG
jgi:hypothetical protein